MPDPINAYKVFAGFYDCYVGKFDGDLDFYRSYCYHQEDILEIGCGTGRVLECLLQAGCKVTGVDISNEMLDVAGEKLRNWKEIGRLELLNHDFTNAALDARYNKALLTFYTFNYITDRPLVFLQHIRQSLSKDGVVLMDLFYPRPLYDPSINGKWTEKTLENDAQTIFIRDRRTMESGVEHRQQVFLIDNGEPARIETLRKYYDPAEMKTLLESAGFVSVEFAPGYAFDRFVETIDKPVLKDNYIVKAVGR